MTQNDIVQKPWALCGVLRDDSIIQGQPLRKCRDGELES
jgi:hypothetical protein